MIRMEKIPTSEEFLLEYDKDSEGYNEAGVLRDFAKLHVKAALEAAAKKAQINDWWYASDNPKPETDEISYYDRDGDGHIVYVDKDSILNAYRLENVK